MLGFVRQPKDFLAGLMFAAFGLFFLIEGLNYRYGTVRSMGPGWFPAAVSWLLIGTGVVVAGKSLVGRRDGDLTFSWPPLFLCTAGIVAFIITLRGAGIVVAVTLLTVVSAYAYHPFKLPGKIWAAGFAAFAAVALAWWFRLLPDWAGALITLGVLAGMIHIARPPMKIWPMALTGLGLGAFSAIAFVRFLGLPFPIIGSWFGG
jgi:hypothetical protein